MSHIFVDKAGRRRRFTGMAAGLAAAVLVAGCGSDDGGSDSQAAGADEAETWSGDDITIVAPTPPGGSFDLNSRQIAPYLGEALGVEATVQNIEGGGYTIGTQVALDDDSCNTLLTHGYPILQVSELTFPVDWTWTDLAPLGGLWLEPPIVRVMNDAPWDTFAELVEDAKENPGEISASLNSATSGQTMLLYWIEDNVGVDFNLVPYQGGGPSRTALLQGEVNFTVPGVFNSLAVDAETKVIGQHSDTGTDFGDLVDNSAQISEQLDVEIPKGFDQVLGMYVSQSSKEEHPDRYELLVSTVEDIMENEDYIADLEETGDVEKVTYQSPEEFMSYGEEVMPVMEDMLELIESEGN